MDAMILGAGLGKRLRPLTETTPKPLIQAGPCRLIEYHLHNLANSRFSNVVINTSYFAEQFVNLIGDGSSYGVTVSYSHEGQTPLETGGGILNALDLINSDPFLIVNADIYTDFDFCNLKMPPCSDAHLVVVDNPPHNPSGDFTLSSDLLNWPTQHSDKRTFTYSGIAILKKSFFENISFKSFPLRLVFNQAIERKRLTGEIYSRTWYDIGDIERLNHLINQLSSSETSP